MIALMLGPDHPAIVEERIGSSQTAGGSGALRLGAELLKVVAPDATVWASTPTWANHIPLISSAGMKMGSYPYYNRETLGVDFQDMLDYLDTNAKRGDIVLLHGCCHNPTGADLSPAEWDRLAPFMEAANARVLLRPLRKALKKRKRPKASSARYSAKSFLCPPITAQRLSRVSYAMGPCAICGKVSSMKCASVCAACVNSSQTRLMCKAARRCRARSKTRTACSRPYRSRNLKPKLCVMTTLSIS